MKKVTIFEQKVYDIVSKIPYGQVMTYQEVAIALGNKNLARAVGNALHNNPTPIVVPCHRVVSSSYRLAINFGSGGLEGHRKLLLQEGHKIIGDLLVRE